MYQDIKIKKIFTLDECKKVIDYCEFKNKWTDGGAPKLPNLKHIELPSVPQIMDIWELDFFREKLIDYVKTELGISIKTAGIHAMKYKEGDSFPRHRDRDGKSEFNMDFLYNINVVLNDDFQGGDFYIEDKKVEGNTPGMVYYYDSTSYHEVTKVTKGTRYSALFYIRDRDIKNIYKVI